MTYLTEIFKVTIPTLIVFTANPSISMECLFTPKTQDYEDIYTPCNETRTTPHHIQEFIELKENIERLNPNFITNHRLSASIKTNTIIGFYTVFIPSFTLYAIDYLSLQTPLIFGGVGAALGATYGAIVHFKSAYDLTKKSADNALYICKVYANVFGNFPQ